MAVVLGGISIPSAMAVNEADLFSTGAFTINTSSANLFLNNLGSTIFTGTDGQEGYAQPSLGSLVLTDGLFGSVTPSGNPSTVASLSDGYTATFNLDLTVNTGGYFLSQIAVYGGWNDAGRDNQDYTVSYQAVGGGAFITLHTVAFAPPANTPSNTFVSLTNLGIGPIQALQFTFNNQENGYAGYREISAIGSAVGSTWVGAADSNWGTGGNWNAAGVPANNASPLLFGTTGANASVDLGSAGRTVTGLLFSSAVGTTIASVSTQTLTFDNGASDVGVTADGTHSITAAVALSSNASFNVGGQLTMGGVISQTAAGKTMTKLGNGVLILGAANTYSGATTVGAGTLRIGVANALPSGGAVTVGGGATLDLNGLNQTVSTVGGDGEVTNNSGTASTLTIGAGGASGSVSTAIKNAAGAVSVVKTGAGTVTLSSLASNYSGGTLVSAGVLGVTGSTASNPLGLGAVTLSGGTLALQGQLEGGLKGEYFGGGPDQANYSSAAALNAYWTSITPAVTAQTTTGGQTDFNFTNGGYGGGAPFAGQGFGNQDNIEARYTGKIYIPQAGIYRFQTTSDDGSIVAIDGTTVALNNFFQGATTRGGIIDLTAGYHDILIGFNEGGGGAGLLVEYTPVGGVSQTLTNRNLVRGLTPSTRQVYSNNVTITTNSTIDVTGSPAASMGALSIGAQTLSLTGMSGASLSFTATALSGNVTFNPAAATTLKTGPVSGGGVTVTKTGNGNVEILPASNYSAGTIINSGVVKIGNAASLGTGTVTLAGGTLSFGVGAPGLFEGLLGGNFNQVDPNTNEFIRNTTRLANSTAAGASIWPAGINDNSTVVYTGYVNNSAATAQTWTFTLGYDDNLSLKIDGQTVLNDQPWGNQKSNVTVTPGYHLFEVRLGQGGGGAGPSNTNWFNIGLGLGIDTQGRNDTVASNYTALPVDPGDGSVFATSVATGYANATVVTGNSTIQAANAGGGAVARVQMGSLSVGANTLSLTGTGTVSNTIAATTTTLTGAATFDVAANTTFKPGVIGESGVRSLTKTGAGTLTAEQAGTFSGGSTVSAGVLHVGLANALGSGPVTLAGGTLRFGVGQPGLYEGSLAGSFNEGGVNPNDSIRLTTRLAELNGHTYPTDGLPDNTTAIYSGLLNNPTNGDVTWTFAENFDDNVLLVIDGQQVLRDTSWNTPTKGNYTLTPGLHRFELRVGQGGGGVGPTNQGWLNNGIGFGIDTQGRNAETASNYQRLSGVGNGQLYATGVAKGYSNATVVTGNSTIDAANSLGGVASAQLAGLSIGGSSTLTVTGNGAVNTVSATGTTLTGDAGFNVAANTTFKPGPINDGAAARSVTKSGAGVIRLDESSVAAANTTLTGTGGGIVLGGLAAAEPLNGGTVVLNGSSLTLDGKHNGAGLLGQYYDSAPANSGGGNPNFATLGALTTHLNSLTPAVTALTTLNGKLDFNFSNDPDNRNGAPFNGGDPSRGNYGFANADNIEARWTGLIYVSRVGLARFETTSDDGTMVFIDGNDTPVVNNNFFQGMTTRGGDYNFTTTGYHKITLAFYEGAGGAGALFRWREAGGAMHTLLNSEVITPFLNAQSYNTKVTVATNSTINVNNSLQATVGALSIGANTLTVASQDTTNAPYSLTAGATTLTGNATINVGASAGGGAGTIKLGPVGQSGGSQALTKAGNGTLVLTGDSSYTGTTVVSAGELRVGEGGTTGSLGAGAVTDNAAIIFNRSNALTVTAPISGTGSVTNAGGASNVLNLDGAQGYAVLNANTGTTNVNGSFTNGTATVNANSRLNFGASQTLGALNIGAGVVVTFGAGAPAFAGGKGASAVVPEPGSIGLLMVGALGLLGRRRRKGA